MKKLEKILRRGENRLRVDSVNEYFALDRKNREQWGWYKKPYSLPIGDFFDTEGEGSWREFDCRIIKEYPLQGRLREKVLPKIGYFWRWRVKEGWYRVKCFFIPKHPMIRKAIPRTWSDITGLIPTINFTMIQDFYHNEVVDGFVDWQADDFHKEFYNWLVAAIKYIEVDRPQLEKQLSESFPSAEDRRKNLPYETLYGKVNELEEIITNKDTEILTEMVKRRGMFWT